MLNEKVEFITRVSSFRTCGYLKRMPRAQPLTLAREFKFQTASHEFSLPSFARYTAAKQNMRKNGLVYHMLTLLQKQADKNSRDYSNYLWVHLVARVSCAATILTKKKACLATSLSKLITIWSQNPCFAHTIIALERLLSASEMAAILFKFVFEFAYWYALWYACSVPYMLFCHRL